MSWKSARRLALASVLVPAWLAAPVVKAQDPSGPDLEIGLILALYQRSPFGGGQLDYSVQVNNRGDEASAATTLRYFRSADSTISPSDDTQVDTSDIAAIEPSEHVTAEADLDVPRESGTYYFYVCVDTVAGESDTTNNCSGTSAVDVPAPDLVVESPSVSDTGPAPGTTLTLRATVRNVGEGVSPVTTLRFFQSTDAMITTSDAALGTDHVPGFSPMASNSGSVEVTAPEVGTYYYGACVDAVAGEADTGNNCSTSVRVDVALPAPDLAVDSPAVNDNSPAAGAAFTLSATVRNVGAADAATTTLRYYRSADAVITMSDTEVGTDAVAGLAAAAISGQSVELTAPSAGTYYYGACVDAVADESDTTNNCSTSVRVDVSEPPTSTGPDLVVGSPSVSDPNPVTGAAFNLSAEVGNDGDGSSATTTLRYYRSADAVITMSDTEVGTDAVAGLAAAAVSGQSVELTAPSAGTYYYGACVDAVADESDTTNNCSTSVRVDVSDAVPVLPLLAHLLLALGLVALGTGFAARQRRLDDFPLTDGPTA